MPTRRQDRKAPADRCRQRQRKACHDTHWLGGQIQHHAGYAETKQAERRVGERAGRVYSTALACLTLEVYYRYLPLEGEGDGAASQPADGPVRPDIGYLPMMWLTLYNQYGLKPSEPVLTGPNLITSKTAKSVIELSAKGYR